MNPYLPLWPAVNELILEFFSPLVDEVQSQLNKHLLKTVCSDITNLLFSAVATEQMLSLADDTVVTPEVTTNIFHYATPAPIC